MDYIQCVIQKTLDLRNPTSSTAVSDSSEGVGITGSVSPIPLIRMTIEFIFSVSLSTRRL